MNEYSRFNRTDVRQASLWQRTAGVPLKSASGRPARFRAELRKPAAPVKRPLGLLWRRGRKSGDVPVLHPVDPWDRMIWVRPDALTLPTEGKRGKRRRAGIAGRNVVAEPVKAAWITSRHGADEAHRFSAGWSILRYEVDPSPSSWHRIPASPDGRGRGQLSRRPGVRRKVVTATFD